MRVLRDRRVPGSRSRANIDRIVIGPAGVFVVDAKRLVGHIEIRHPLPPITPAPCFIDGDWPMDHDLND